MDRRTKEGRRRYLLYDTHCGSQHIPNSISIMSSHVHVLVLQNVSTLRTALTGEDSKAVDTGGQVFFSPARLERYLMKGYP